MLTRKQYMAGKCTHDAYYSEIAKEAGICWDEHPKLPEIIHCLLTGDEHLNRIPLDWWDAQGIGLKLKIVKSLKKRGDFYSMAEVVCILKAAARVASMKVIQNADVSEE